MNKKNQSQSEIFARIMKALVPYSGSISASVLLALATVILTLRIPILTGQAVDCIISAGSVDSEALFEVLKEMSITVVFTFFTQWAMNRINNRVTYSVTRELREAAFERMQRMPLSLVDGHGHGDYMSRIVSDADTFADGLLMGFTQAFTGIMTILGTIWFMVQISLPISVIVIVLTPASLLVAKFVSSRSYRYFKEQASLKGAQTSFVEEMIEQESIVKLNAFEDEAIALFDEKNEALSKAALSATFYSSLVNPSTRLINNLIYALVGVAGALIAIEGGITVGGLTSFLSYSNTYAKPFNEISGVITEFQNALACAGRLFEMIDAPCEEEEVKATLGQVKGRIEFKDVCFSYDKEKPLIENLNLTVEPGQRIAIVGPTGGGKSTIINLLMRFYEIDAGEILIDGVDIRDISRDELHGSFGMVLQETWLKEDSARANLAMAAKDAELEEIKEAAKSAHAHSFIKRLPKGYDTVLTDGGASLSQGQKQLMCIARTMLHLPPMLILDEATSSIDTRTEQKIQAAFNLMMEGRTTFVVAHRLSTIKNADLILFVKDGKVVEQGNHAFLLRKNGFYAKLYQSQFEEL